MPTKAYEGIDQYMSGCDELQLKPKETMKLLEEYARETDPEKKREIRNRIVMGNIKLVLHVAKRYTSSGIPVVELLQEGSIGLMKAVEGFDLSRNVRFSTYAVHWIRQFISRYIRNTQGVIRIPVGTRDRAAKLLKLRDQMWSELGREPSDDELLERSGFTESQFEAAQAALISYVSLDAPLYSEPWEPGTSTVGDFIACDDDPSLLGSSPEDECLEQEDGRDLYEAWQALTPREQKVLALYCGFTPDGEPRSLRDIGRELGVTRERARQIKNEAVARLRECLCCDEAHSQIA